MACLDRVGALCDGHEACQLILLAFEIGSEDVVDFGSRHKVLQVGRQLVFAHEAFAHRVFGVLLDVFESVGFGVAEGFLLLGDVFLRGDAVSLGGFHFEADVFDVARGFAFVQFLVAVVALGYFGVRNLHERVGDGGVGHAHKGEVDFFGVGLGLELCVVVGAVD